MANLLAAWREFARGKMSKPDVLAFYEKMEDNIFALHYDLMSRNYRLDPYEFFYVRDPKLRPIHKASVRDRVLFQAVFRVLYQIFDRRFIFDSYSSRLEKGTHAGVKRLADFLRRASINNSRTVYVLKCDVRKFFYSTDHGILKSIISRLIGDREVLRLLNKIIDSFETAPNCGLPLGNVTSQLFANIYLNELDQFVKHQLREKYYLRYCDDFAIVSRNRNHLAEIIPRLEDFLIRQLKLSLHPRKVEIRKFSQGIDFLGYVVLPHYCVLRTKTKRRMIKKMFKKRMELNAELINEKKFNQSLNSYLGILKHCEGQKIKRRIIEGYL